MIESAKEKSKVVSLCGAAGPGEKLPYRIELWDMRRDRVERVVARAASASLARAIFAAAQSEHLGRYITLSRGGRIVAEST